MGMRKPLKNPELPPGAIVATHEDGGALRNDGVRLTPASQNPWYVLATVFGEQDGERFDEELHVKNTLAWNNACAKFWEDSTDKIVEFMVKSSHGSDACNIANLDEAVMQAFRDRADCAPEELASFSEIEFASVLFPCRLSMRGFYFPLPLRLSKITCEKRLDISNSRFQGDVSFDNCHVVGPGKMESSYFEGQLELEDFTVRNSLYCNDIEVKAGVRIDNLRAQTVFWDRTKISGDCEIERLNVNMFSMRSAECAMNTSLSGNVQSRMSLQDLKTEFSCKLDGLFVKGDTDISDAEFGGYFSAVGSRFEKSFRSENTTYEAHSKFGPLSSFGNANFNGSRFANKTSFWASYFLHSAPSLPRHLI
jgi:hypothetical protein